MNKFKPLNVLIKPLLLLSILLPFISNGQVNIIIPSGGGTPSTLTACQGDGNFTFSVANFTSSTMSGDSLIIDLPEGTYYTPGSINGAFEEDISDLNNPIFILDDIPIGNTSVIQYKAKISCAYDNLTAVFEYEVLSGGLSYTNSTAGIGNALVPDLTFPTIIGGDGDIVNIFDNGTWNITITQTTPNTCVSELFLIVDHTSKLSLVSTSAGTTTTTVSPSGTIYDTIVLNSTDLMTLGDADGQLCFNESITFDQVMKLLGCDVDAGDSIQETEARIRVGMSCFGDTCFTNEAFAALNPNLSNITFASGVISRQSPGFCKRGYLEAYMTNTSPPGNPIIDVEVYAGSYNWHFQNEMQFDSLMINGVLLDTVNTAGQSFSYTGFWQAARMRNLIDYYTFDFDGPGGFSDLDGDGFYDDLDAGDTIISRFTVDYLPENISECVGFSNSGVVWISGGATGLAYKTICGEEGDYSGQRVAVYRDRALSMTSAIDDPNIYDGSLHTYTIDVNVDVMHQYGCSSPTDSLVAMVVVPPGVLFDTARPVLFQGVVKNVVAISGDTVWIDISDGTGFATAGELDFPILGDCSSITGLDTLVGGSSCASDPSTGQFQWEFIYYCDPVNCGQSMKLYCGSSTITWAFHCPIGPCNGLTTLDFQLNRVNLGWSDVLATIEVDPVADSTINLKAAFNKDRVRMTSSAIFNGIETDSIYFGFQSGTVQGAPNPADPTWLLQEGSIIHYDVENGVYDTIVILTSDYSTVYQGGGVHTTTFNFLGDIINTRGANTLTDQDSVFIEMDLIVSDNVGTNYLNTVPYLLGNYYQIKDGFACICDQFSENFELGRPTFTNSVYVGYTNRYFECYTHSNYTRRGYAYRMLEPHFPNESRPYFRRDSILVRLPAGVSFGTNGYLRTITREEPVINNWQTIPIDSTWSVGSWNYALLRNPGTWTQPDIGRGTDNARSWFQFDYNIDCRMLNANAFQAYVTYYGDNYAWADSTQIDNNHSFSQYVSVFNAPASVANSALNPTYEGIRDTAEWSIQYQNFSFGNPGYDNIDNNWLLFESPGNDVQIHSVKDVTSNTILPVVTNPTYPNMYYVEIGTLNGNSVHQFDVKGTYSTCDFTSINVYRENNCTSYPTNPFIHEYDDGDGAYTCVARDTTLLFIDPQDIQMGMTITSPTVPQNICDSALITLEVENTGISQAFDLSVDAELPPGLHVNVGSTEIEYPLNSGTWLPLVNPVNTSGNTWNWDITGDTVNGIFSLANISDIPNNGYKIRFYVSTDCEFPSGTEIGFYANAESACGDTSRVFASTDPFDIIPISESNNYSLTPITSQLYVCGDSSETFFISIENLGGGTIPGDTTTGKEVIILQIDNSIAYDTSGFNGIHNSPLTEIVTDSSGNTYVEWSVPSGIVVGDSIVFEYALFVDDPISLRFVSSLDHTIGIYYRDDIACAPAPSGICENTALVIEELTSITIVSCDTDGDGISDNIDLDDDNDGIPDTEEDLNTDLDNDPFTNPSDKDGDGIPNYLDIDADNDGIPDVVEAGGNDSDGDGHVDYQTPGDPTTMLDVDNDGLIDDHDNINSGSGAGEVTNGTPLPNPDSDGDNFADYLDIDADDDGIVDNIEGQASTSYIPPSYTDTDQDGLDDAYDGDDEGAIGIGGGTGTTIVPVDTDVDTIPDYLDLNTDNDWQSDLVEGWDTDNDWLPNTVPSGNDSDSDGLDDAFDVDGSSTTDTGGPTNNGTVPTDFPNLDRTNAEMDWRDPLDSDGDGIVDNIDVDDDNDGVPDVDEDSNTDGDSDPGTDPTDRDGDGVPDFLDLDSDNDGIADVVEAGGIDSDGDGHVDYPTPGDPTTMVDTDNDGLLDTIDDIDNGSGAGEVTNGTPLPNPDTDTDNIVDIWDIDADDDGIVDNIEGQTSTGYIPPTGNDTDMDGLDDAYDGDDENTIGIGGGTGTAIVPIDTDSDNNPDYVDLNADGDFQSDLIEGWDTDNDWLPNTTPSGIDSDGDGLDDAFDTDGTSTVDAGGPTNSGTVPTDFPNLDNPNLELDWRDVFDSDGDGVSDDIDLDDDNDGIPDVSEDANTDGDNNPNTNPSDQDGDGIPNHLDLDSDNDGITDIIEAGGTDNDGDGHVDYPTPGDPTTMVDVDNDGLLDAIDNIDNGSGAGEVTNGTPLPNPDTDMDNLVDVLDIDADNDGIVDNIEGQSTLGYIPPTGNDTDRDGLDDAYDGDDENTVGIGGGTGVSVVPVDTDTDSIPDYLDLDTDGDFFPDLLEGWDANGDGVADVVPSGNDSDGDGLDDAFDTDGTSTTNAGGPTNSGTVPNDFPDTDFVDGDRDWREAKDLPDADNDGIPDVIDIDDDNDGILDTVELATALNNGDTDNDGIQDHLDLDADNDGIPDIIEANGVDTNGDGTIDNFVDTDGDGWGDTVDPDDGGTPWEKPNTDGDTQPDFQDLDSDNDGISDIVEDGGIDTNGDGTVDNFDDSNDDGMDDQKTTNGAEDKDGDTIPDYRDLDSDNDGIPDIIEDGGVDTDTNGVVDNFTDLDNDGWDDNNPLTGFVDFDGDGIPNHEDLDSDNDGIPDIVESGSVDTDNDGTVDNFTDPDGDGWDEPQGTVNPVDTDGDGLPDYTDLDADNDGIPDIVEAGNDDNDGNGTIDNFSDPDENGWDDPQGTSNPVDTDNDGIPDYLDLDADSDGVKDIVEAEGDDDDDDGVVDNFTDPDGDGWDKPKGTSDPADTDNDGKADFRDIDDDNDGVLTANELDEDANNIYDDCDQDDIPDYLDPDGCGLFVPEGFSPNGDGVNDLFVIRGIDLYPNNTLLIINRWGDKVFEVTTYRNEWDGSNQFGVTIGGDELPVGTYYYILDLGDGSEPLTGYVYLNR